MAVADGYFDGDADFIDQRRENEEYEAGARYDYAREAFGDPCPRHPGVLRGGADCWRCEQAAHLTPGMLDGQAFKPMGADDRDVVKFFAAQGLLMIVAGTVRLTRKGQTAA